MLKCLITLDYFILYEYIYRILYVEIEGVTSSVKSSPSHCDVLTKKLFFCRTCQKKRKETALNYENLCNSIIQLKQ